MRGPACYTNCCPAPAPVVISQTVVDGSGLRFVAESFGFGAPKAVTSFPSAVPVFVGGAQAHAQLRLDYLPVSRHSVQLHLKGTAHQRPLIGRDGAYDASLVTPAFDFWVDGQTVYLNFRVSPSDSFLVTYPTLQASAAIPAATPAVSYFPTAFVDAFGPGRTGGLITVLSDEVEVGDETLSFTGYVDLSATPESPASVVLHLGGTQPQRPMIGYDADASGPCDYFVVGSRVYFRFPVVAADEVFVRYFGTNASARPSAVTGEMQTISVDAVDDATEATSGWCLADGFTRYSIAAFPALHAFASANSLLAAASVSSGLAPATSAIDPATTFVLKYLVPHSYGEQGLDPDTGELAPARSASERVEIKA